MNKNRRTAIANLIEEVEKLKSWADELQGEEQEYYDNMPEGIQSGEKGDMAEQSADQLQSATDALDEVAGYLQESME